jgi:quercetin dioxygenase-like cupin family protein
VKMMVSLMTPSAASWCALLFGLCSVAAAQIPVQQEPHHRPVFENQDLRILDINIPAGEITLEHTHSNDYAGVCIQGASARLRPQGADWRKPGQRCMPGRIGVTDYTDKPVTHTVQNMDTVGFHQVLVENLRKSGWSSYPPISAPATTLAKESRSFLVYEVQLGGESRETTHTHQVPTVAILVSGDAASGTHVLDQPGRWIFIPAGKSHTLTSQGGAKLVEIEVR